MNRKDIAKLIAGRLSSSTGDLTDLYNKSCSDIGYFYIDDLLPDALAKRLYSCFPDVSTLNLKKTKREFKFVSAQMDKYDSLLEEALFAFQEREVLDAISLIVGKADIHGDDKLYAGGISMMGDGHYLNPHLDNSHDMERNMWRVFNLLYYVSPKWELLSGGNLELWANGVEGESTTIQSKFNRLVVMATSNNSWHSVSPITSDKIRTCISNYYFSPTPIDTRDKFHVTSFRGRPGNSVDDLILRGDALARSFIRTVFHKGLFKPSHFYKKK